MRLTTRQKILLGVFLVGLVGLIADRTVLRPQGGPPAASAESSATSHAAVPSGGPPDAADPPTRAPLAERLNHLLPNGENRPAGPRDPFALPASWSGSGAANKEGIPDVARAFARRHQLKAVVVQGGDVGAQVDDSFLRPGQTLDEFQLVSVDSHAAVFEREGLQVTLELTLK